jgi:parvulin-like peptidyl-prolyl isomerase
MKQQMIARMLEDDAAKLPETVISADDIARYYEDHRDEFEKPAAASIRRIVVKDKETAEIVATQAKAARKPDFAVDQRAFEELALRHGRSGEDAAGKESPFFEEKGAPYPEAVTRAVFAMTELGVVAGPIETEQGFQVIKLAGRRAEVSRALGEVREQIRQRLLLDRRNKRMEAFVSELRKNVLVEVDEGALEKMRLDESSTDSKASP